MADARPSGSWFIEGSVAHIFGSDGLQDNWGHVPGSGTAWNATLGRQTLPWLAFTGEAELLQVNEILLGGFVEDNWTLDTATHATFMTGVRVGPPIDLGLTPSLEFATGVGWLRWGDRHITSMFDGHSRTLAGERDVAWGWSAGVRLRYATRPQMLTPEAATRAIMLYERGHPVTMLMLGFGLRY